MHPVRTNESHPHASAPQPVARSAPLGTPASSLDYRSSEDLSVRQWFWMGLLQDRPIVLAVLAGLLLLLLSALVAGICLLAERL